MSRPGRDDRARILILRSRKKEDAMRFANRLWAVALTPVAVALTLSVAAPAAQGASCDVPKELPLVFFRQQFQDVI